MITVSVVSHGQGALVLKLLRDIQKHCTGTSLHVLLTLNFDEILPFEVEEFSFEIQISKNTVCRGFAANHNAAFVHARGEYFCVLNPDIRFESDPFPVLTAALTEAGMVGPLVVGPEGHIEDSARRFPTPFGILRKVFSGPHVPDYEITGRTVEPDWIAGMFMLWRSEVFRRLDGFDEGFFLYYEDVDACARLRQLGGKVLLIPAARVTHHARRASHRNLRYLRWHVSSMFRYFWKTFVHLLVCRVKC